MDLRRLKALATVTRELHVTRAAEQLGIAQPALTRLTRGIERDLSGTLVHKTGRDIALTDAGPYLFVETRALLRSYEAMCLTAKAIGSGQTGHVWIGLPGAMDA